MVANRKQNTNGGRKLSLFFLLAKKAKTPPRGGELATQNKKVGHCVVAMPRLLLVELEFEFFGKVQQNFGNFVVVDVATNAFFEIFPVVLAEFGAVHPCKNLGKLLLVAQG